MNKEEIIKDLQALKGTGPLVTGLRLCAESDFEGCIKMILDQAQDGRQVLISAIGEDLLRKVEEFNR